MVEFDSATLVRVIEVDEGEVRETPVASER